MWADLFFRCGTRSAARALSAHGIPTYLYLFDFHPLLYRDPASLACHLEAELDCGVYHGAELTLVFGDGLVTAAAKNLSNSIQTYWTNLAKYGTPNGPGVPVVWPEYNQSFDMHLALANEVRADSHLSKSNCDFWASLPTMGPYPG